MAYLSKEKTIEAIRKYADIKHSNGEQIEYVNGILKSISVINEQPTADVVEVKQVEIIRDDLKWWLETNSEKGVVYIPKYVVENMIAKMEGDKSDG